MKFKNIKVLFYIVITLGANSQKKNKERISKHLVR